MTERGNGFDFSRAELFEALGHPIRVKILHSLETKPLGFAELKREVGVESSGHLQFHLGKLAGLVGTTPDGSYALTDDGREAIRVLKSVPASHGETISGERASIFRWNQWSKPLLAILLIVVVVLAAVAVYQQQQITTMNRDLSSATVSIGGTRYYYETVTAPVNGTKFQFHGVTFTVLAVPIFQLTYSNPINYTYQGSVWLTNGTLVDLTGKTVMTGMSGFCEVVTNSTGASVQYALGYCLPAVGMSIVFPDGTQVVRPGFNVTVRNQNVYTPYMPPVYILTYTTLPSTPTPWFTQHEGISAGFFENVTAPLTLYVSVPS